MSWFADLSPYTYSQAPPLAEGDLNVGWLDANHPFSRGQPHPELVDALLRCALWPVRRHRGYHCCELCGVFSVGMIADLAGRDVSLGNGEIRASAHDGQWYSAPTLVAHYVADHQYAPPAAFVDAVLRHAATLHVVTGARLRQLAMLDEDSRFEICVRALDAFVRVLGVPALAAAVARIRTLAPTLEAVRTRQNWRAVDEAARSFAFGNGQLAALAEEAALRTAHFFRDAPPDASDRDHSSLQNTARVVELAEQAGIKLAP